MRTSLFGLCACAVFAPITALAAPTVYQCELKVGRLESWVPEQLVIAHDTEAGTVLVSDPIILHFNDKQPLAGELVVQNAKRTTFKWALVDVVNRSGQQAPRFVYRATVQASDKTVRVVAKPLGYPNDFKAKGRCQVGTPSG